MITCACHHIWLCTWVLEIRLRLRLVQLKLLPAKPYSWSSGFIVFVFLNKTV